MKSKMILKCLVIAATAGMLAACSSAPKDEISSSANPREEITRLNYDLASAQEANVDVLARKEFSKSTKYLENAKEKLGAGESQEKIIEDLRYGREYLKLATAQSGTRQDKAPGLFAARQKAMKAGAARSEKFKNEWDDLDDDIADISEKIDKSSPEELNKYQSRYVALERKAVIETQLGRANAQINGARSEGAGKRAPLALRKAEMSLKTAENLIGSNVSNPAGYRQAVGQADANALYLSEVMAVIKQNGKSLSEEAAAKLVSQKRQISDLQANLSTSEGATSDAESRLSEKNKSLQQKDVALNTAQASIAIQSAMEKSRQQFSSEEAEAYQQGENLLIRLKSMNFQSGRSNLPTESLALLAKVSEIAKSLNAKAIKVEGHTDSLGSKQANMKLSELRAQAVATYLKTNGFADTQVESEGHGFQHPIATNKSKAGRAQNRRVDIMITPNDGASTMQ